MEDVSTLVTYYVAYVIRCGWLLWFPHILMPGGDLVSLVVQYVQKGLAHETRWDLALPFLSLLHESAGAGVIHMSMPSVYVPS